MKYIKNKTNQFLILAGGVKVALTKLVVFNLCSFILMYLIINKNILNDASIGVGLLFVVLFCIYLSIYAMNGKNLFLSGLDCILSSFLAASSFLIVLQGNINENITLLLLSIPFALYINIKRGVFLGYPNTKYKNVHYFNRTFENKSI